MLFCGDPIEPRLIGIGHLTSHGSGDLCQVTPGTWLFVWFALVDPAIINPALRIGLCRREVAVAVSHYCQPLIVLTQQIKKTKR